MSVKCLGKPTWSNLREIHLQFVEKTPERERIAREQHIPLKRGSPFELHGKEYYPLKGIKGKPEMDERLNNCVNALRRSRKEPQLIGEIKSVGQTEEVNHSTLLRLWLYDGKIYEVDRNDYDKKQVKLLILNFLDRERKKFQKLERKYQFKKEVDPGR